MGGNRHHGTNNNVSFHSLIEIACNLSFFTLNLKYLKFWEKINRMQIIILFDYIITIRIIIICCEVEIAYFLDNIEIFNLDEKFGSLNIEFSKEIDTTM